MAKKAIKRQKGDALKAKSRRMGADNPLDKEAEMFYKILGLAGFETGPSNSSAFNISSSCTKRAVQIVREIISKRKGLLQADRSDTQLMDQSIAVDIVHKLLTDDELNGYFYQLKEEKKKRVAVLGTTLKEGGQRIAMLGVVYSTEVERGENEFGVSKSMTSLYDDHMLPKFLGLCKNKYYLSVLNDLKESGIIGYERDEKSYSNRTRKYTIDKSMFCEVFGELPEMYFSMRGCSRCSAIGGSEGIRQHLGCILGLNTAGKKEKEEGQ